MVRFFLYISLFVTQLVGAHTAFDNRVPSPGVCNHGPAQTLGITPDVDLTNPLPILKADYSSSRKATSKLSNKLFSTLETATSFDMDLKILILTATTNANLEEPAVGQLIESLRNYGIQYEHRVLTLNGERISEAALNLINEDGSGKYSGIVLSNGQLAFKKLDGSFTSALTVEQWSELNQYKINYKVRQVALFSYPTPALGVKYLSDKSTTEANVLVASDLAKSLDKALPTEVAIPLENVWYYPSVIIDSNIAKPLYYLKNTTSDEGQVVAGVVAHLPDGREEMHFFFAQSIYHLSSVATAPTWIHWLTHNFFLGKRRVYMNVQIDDFFLSTGLFEITQYQSDMNEAYVYRLTSDDMGFFVNWQKNVFRPIAKKKDFKIELAYNGQGILDHGGIVGYAGDELFKYSLKVLPEFNWLTHTFTHGDLNWLSYDKSFWELKANILIANDMFPTAEEQQYFSPDSMVTPRISGFFNPGALKALYDNKIIYTVGDNTRAEILPPFQQVGLWTTEAFNGFSGIFIVPRYATEIYYNVSLPRELEAEYNFVYRKYFGRDLKVDEIFEREGTRVSRQLLNYQPSPYMFHQSNLRSFPWKNGERMSLVSIWMDKVASEVRKYSTLPILSEKMSVLAPIYLERMAFESCGYKARLKVERGHIVGLTSTSTQNCPVYISGGTFKQTPVQVENYGPEHTEKFNSLAGQNLNLTLKLSIKL